MAVLQPPALRVAERAAASPAILTQGSSPSNVDVAALYLAYMACFGDEAKTAVTLDLPLQTVRDIALRERWHERAEALKKLEAAGGTEALATELNRTANLVQAVKLRGLIDRAVRTLTANEADFDALLSTQTEKTSNKSCKALLDLVKAAEAIHKMTYAALADSGAKAVGDGKEANGKPSMSKGLSLWRALSQLNSSTQLPTK